MDNDDLRIYKRLGILFLVSLFGMWHGCTDISYMVSSKTTTAKIVKSYDIPGRRGRAPVNKNVTFTFTDKDGNECKGYDSVDINWQPSSFDGTVEIAYIPGKMRVSGGNTEARLTENSSIGGILIFFLAGSLLAYNLYTFYRNLQSAPAT